MNNSISPTSGQRNVLWTLRKWSRGAWLLHGWLVASLVLMPCNVRAGWVDTDSNPALDSWDDGINVYSVAALDALEDTDIDEDNAYNSDELYYGSNPFEWDTDFYGLDDGTEIHVAIQQVGKS